MNDMQKELLRTFAETFVGALDLDALVVWADTLKVEHGRDTWIDDDYPDKEDDLRGRVVDAFVRLGEKK